MRANLLFTRIILNQLNVSDGSYQRLNDYPELTTKSCTLAKRWSISCEVTVIARPLAHPPCPTKFHRMTKLIVTEPAMSSPPKTLDRVHVWLISRVSTLTFV